MANEEAKPDKEAAQAPPKPPLDIKKLLVLGLAVLNLVVIGGSAYVIWLVKLGTHRESITEQTETSKMEADRDIRSDSPVLYSFDPFTVNLDGKPRKLVQTTIQLEMLNEEGYEEAVDLKPVARDHIVRILNTKKYEDIETIQGKLFLKEQIMTALNGLFRKGSVKEVYFNNFVVQ